MNSILLRAFLISLILSFVITQGTVIKQLNITLQAYSQLHVTIFTKYLSTISDLHININYISSSNGKSTHQFIYSHQIFKNKDTAEYSLINFHSASSPINLQILANNEIVSLRHNKVEQYFLAIIDSYTTQDYMLPFNMRNLKLPEIYFLQRNSSFQSHTKSMQPFMSSYWTELKRSMLITPSIPYISECLPSNHQVMLNDVLRGNNCELDELSRLICHNSQLQYDYVLEQLQVIKTNIKQQFWFNKKERIIYYLFNSALSHQEIQGIKHQMEGVYSLPFSIFENLVPMYYYRQSTHRYLVNDFQIIFRVKASEENGFTIAKALTIGRYNKDLVVAHSKVTIKIEYLTFIQSFIYFELHIGWYALFALLLSILIYLVLSIYKLTRIVIVVEQKIEIFIIPAIKGIIYAIMTVGLFFIVLNSLFYYTGLRSISSTYDGQLDGIELEFNEKGRNSLGILLIGLYMLNASIKQVFKVSSSDELKIVFEDDLMHKGMKKEEHQFQKKIEFTKKNMYSHKNYIFISFMLVTLLNLMFCYLFSSLKPYTMALFLIFSGPIIYEISVQTLKHFIFKQSIYFVSVSVAVKMIIDLLPFFTSNINQFGAVYASVFICQHILFFILQIALQKLWIKIENTSQESKVAKLLYKIFKTIIQNKKKESPYEKALFYSGIIIINIIGIIMKPFNFLFFYLMEKNKILQLNFMIDFENIYSVMVMIAILIPIELFTCFLASEFLKHYCDINVQEVIRFNQFKFKKRKFRWMNDQFAHNQNIRFYYQQFEKFSFSSQLYQVITMMGLSAFFIIMGSMLIIQSEYLLFNDPIVVVMFLIIWIIGDILSIIVSFMAVKLKLYDKNEEQAMRQNLVKIDKYLKTNDTAEYLQLEGVKDYFLLYNKNWIIKNLGKIFTKQDFQQNDSQLINIYKKYKSNFLKKEIEKKRKIKQLKNNNSYQDYNSTIQNRLVFDKQKFNNVVRPIAYYWYYLAKQNLYLKNIVNKVKKEKIQDVCQFCFMDVQIQPLEKKNFQDLLNLFRTINVGRIFREDDFLQFYRLKQEYITICAGCKEKNKHVECKITTKSIQSKLMLRWYMIAKSRLLHKPSRNK